ncbi:MAG TPA: PAS domain S-box protein [Gallionellaceae bacterium]|nr:PAS domain S-box protein [Gallionellaceae bacterium]
MKNTASEQRPKRMVKYSAALLALVLLAYAAFLGTQAWRETQSAQAGQLATIAALSANSIDIYLAQLQIGMQNLGADVAATRNKPDLDRAYAQVQRFQALHTELGNVMLLRGDGQILLTGTTPHRADLPTLAGEPAFRQTLSELQAAPHFAIGQPVAGHIDRNWVVSARYGVTDQAGKLAYIISANLPANMLQRFRMDSTTPAISALGLLRDDGYLVARHPEPDAASLDALYGKPVEGALAEQLRAVGLPQQGPIEMRGRDGRTTGLLALRRLQHYPLTLFVEMPMSEVRAAWWHNMHAAYFLMALLLACTFALYSLKRRRRVWTAEQRREALRRNYEEALLAGSPNEILMFDTNTYQISYANDAALKNLGYTLAQLQQKNMLALQAEPGIEAFQEKIGPLLSGEHEVVNYEAVQVRANGSTYPVEVNLELITAEDGRERYLAIINDLTALKQAEANIRKFNAPIDRRAAREKA